MKQPKDRVIGCEYEILALQADHDETLDYDGIRRLLEFFTESFDWEPVYEGSNIVALSRNGQSITLEPGGQFEMSGAQKKTLHEVDKELSIHLDELRAAREALGVRFEWMGLNPHQSVEQIQWMPKKRYEFMRRYLLEKGSLGHYMMGLTCTVQANLDVTGAEDFALKLRTASGIGVLVNALFANSPTYAGKNTKYQSYRAHIWTDVDSERCGLHRFVFEQDASWEDYADWASNVPMFGIYRDEHFIEIGGKLTFKDLMVGDLEGHEATLEDWKYHLGTLFPEARARPHLEVRSADVVPPEAIVACPAIWTGILYDDDCTLAAWDLVKKFSFLERVELLEAVAKNGINTKRPSGAGHLGDLCRELIEISAIGLGRVEPGRGSEQFLDPLREIISTGKSYADQYVP